jgi:hypothetical protein
MVSPLLGRALLPKSRQPKMMSCLRDYSEDGRRRKRASCTTAGKTAMQAAGQFVLSLNKYPDLASGKAAAFWLAVALLFVEGQSIGRGGWYVVGDFRRHCYRARPSQV